MQCSNRKRLWHHDVWLQVLGHTKTLLVLLISWGVLHEHMSPRKLAGMMLAVVGMVAYGYFNSRAQSSSSKAGSSDKLLLPVRDKDKLPELTPLLPRDKAQPDAPTVLTGGKGRATEKRATAVTSAEPLSIAVVAN